MPVGSSLIQIARICYRAIPLRGVRALAYSTFARSVRNRRIVREIDGICFDLDLGEVIDLQLYLRQYEPDVTAAIRRLAKAGMTVLDIGANIGAHTLLFARLTGPAGRVIAFEPTDFAFRKLERNLSLNAMPQVVAVKVALSDHAARGRTVHFRSSWRTDGARRDTPSTVDFDRLDDLLRAQKIDRVDLVKIDVDGNEFSVLGGGAQVIQRNRPTMFMEAVGPHFDDDSRNPFRLLAAIGYRFRDLKSGAKLSLDDMRRRLPRGDVGMTTSFNVIAEAGETQDR